MITGKILLLFTGIKRPLLSGIIKAGIKPLTLEPFALSRGLFLKKKKSSQFNHFAVGQVTVAGVYSVAKGLGSAPSWSILSVYSGGWGGGPGQEEALGQKQGND